MDKLLSIVIPTKNRAEYLKVFIETIASFNNSMIELVVHDNSDSDTELSAYLDGKNFPNLIYAHSSENLSVVENSNRAIEMATGKYVCFMGDDDIVSKNLYDFVVQIDACGVESAIFKTAQYYWPGTTFKAHKFPNLIVKNFKGKIRKIDPPKALDEVLNHGGVSLGDMPRLYHGVVLRDRLNDVYKRCGTYFPGPSPDMANAVALCYVVTSHIYCDIPLVIAGASPKSAAGMGTAHMHKGNLKDVAFLPKGVETRWNLRIPKIWTGPTIYAQSLYEALVALNDNEKMGRFNYIRHYAYFSVFCSSDKYLLKDIQKQYGYSRIKFFFLRIGIFGMRVRRFCSNKLLLWFGIGGSKKDSIFDTNVAQQEVDKQIGNKRLNKALNKMKRDGEKK